MSNTTDTQAGTMKFICPTCDEQHEADVEYADLKNGYILGECYHTGGKFEVPLDLNHGRPEPKGNVRANSLNSNYPNGFGGF